MPPRLTRVEFHRWAAAQTGRYERVAGEPIAMSPERIQHIRLKSRVWMALDRAIREAGLDCEALADGVTVEVDADTDYEPDAVVNCGPRLPPDATAATNPVVGGRGAVAVNAVRRQQREVGRLLSCPFNSTLPDRPRSPTGDHSPLAGGGGCRFARDQCWQGAARSAGDRV